MNKKITIAIDAMGGDNAPTKTIEGVALFLNKNKNQNDFFLNLFGDEEKIKDLKQDMINLFQLNCSIIFFISRQILP